MHRETLQRAVRNQNKVKFHTLVDQFPGTRAQAAEYLTWIKRLIPLDKYQVFLSLFRYPLKTTEITGVINDKLSRVFNGIDRVTNVQFIDNSIKDDQAWYFNNVLDWFNRWETEGFEYSKTEFNSVIVCDLPATPPDGGKYPVPYWYWVFADHIIDYEIADAFKGAMKWIAFKQAEDKLVVIDAFSYRVFPFKDGRLQPNAEPITDSPHGLGYCPARFFWDVPLDVQAPDLKWNPVLREIESLEWFLFFYINKHYSDMFNAYPIFSVLEEHCNFNNEEQVCDGGALRNKETGHFDIDRDGNIIPCPSCARKRLVGAGTVVERPMPSKEFPDIDPIKKISADTGSLSYNVDEIKRLRNEIIYACTGSDGDVLTREAVNEEQVAANYEDQTQILRRYKNAFENAMNWTAETLCRLRYGDRFLSFDSNLGSDFYIRTEESLRKQYQAAKTGGASEAELIALSQRIMETAHRNDPAQMERMSILADLEPYRSLSRMEVLDMYGKGMIDELDMRIKLNFDSFIRRFERENINITEFGINALAYSERINRILTTLKMYADEQRRSNAGSGS